MTDYIWYVVTFPSLAIKIRLLIEKKVPNYLIFKNNVLDICNMHTVTNLIRS